MIDSQRRSLSEAKKDRNDNQSLTNEVFAGDRYYYHDVHTIFLKSLLDTDDLSLERLKDFHYSDTVVPTSKQVFGLHEYVTHPEWVKHWEYEDTYDIYV